MAQRAGGRERRAVQRIRSSELVATTRRKGEHEEKTDSVLSEEKKAKTPEPASHASSASKRGGDRKRETMRGGRARKKQSACKPPKHQDEVGEDVDQSTDKNSDDDDLDLPLSKRRKTNEKASGRDETTITSERVDAKLVREQLSFMLDGLTMEQIRALTSKACRRQLEEQMKLKDGSLDDMKSQIDEDLMNFYNKMEQKVETKSLKVNNDDSDVDDRALTDKMPKVPSLL
eukprot:759967-Hanusia_phi.AAC.3